VLKTILFRQRFGLHDCQTSVCKQILLFSFPPPVLISAVMKRHMIAADSRQADDTSPTRSKLVANISVDETISLSSCLAAAC